MSTADWFAKKLGGAAPVAASTTYQPAPGHTAPGAQPAPPPPKPKKHESLSDALADPNLQTRGGQATRTELESCPGCGSDNYFSRSNGGMSPRKHCYDCGYPVVQYGSLLGEGGTAQSLGGGQ